MLSDQPARDAIANALDETLVVEAAAGTGKTTELVKRILRVLSTGRTTVDRIVAVTFTEKAAGELKLRLREALERERHQAPASDDAPGSVRQRLDEALAKLEEAHVSTIHGFCAELLRERPVEAGIDPLFTVLTETQSQRVFDDGFATWVQEQLAEPREGVRRALRRSPFVSFSGARGADDGPLDRLRRAAWEVAQWRDFSAPWTRRPFDRRAAIDALIGDLREFCAVTERPSYSKDTLYTDTAPARHLWQEISLQRSIGDADYDGWEARLIDLSRDKSLSRARQGRGSAYGPGVPRTTAVAALGALRNSLEGFRYDADADLAAALQQELAGAVDRYETLKARAGSLDFLDLLVKARDLVRNNAPVRRGFQDRFTHLFIDEFQDTDPLQAEILLLLAADDPSVTEWRHTVPVPGRLFIVGDPKQSIYRFRRADVAIYAEVCAQLERSGARRVHLTTSFRSVPNIQACVNAAFAPVMTGDPLTLQADYVPLAAYRGDIPTQPSVVALPVPKPYGFRNLSAMAIEASLPDAAGAFVSWLVTKSGWLVTERTGATPVPVKARHVCILFRRFLSFGQDMTQPYVQALEARGVRHVLVGGKTFHDREEVETIRAALAAIEWPDDELSVFATLRGSLFAIGDEELFEWKQTVGRLHPFRTPEVAPHLAPIAAALRTIAALHRRRNYVPIADTLQRLLSATRAHVGFVLRSAGEQALANVLHISELAREYEAGGGISFRGFVEELRRAGESAAAAEAPILEEGSDGVRLMTVHKAKGLEFPVVILADLTCKLSRAEASRWIDAPNNLCALRIGGWAPIDLLLHDADEAARDRSEGDRLAYVAATRARDLLVVPAVGDGPYEGGWLEPLMAAVYPPAEVRRHPSRATGCPPFVSKDSVVQRPNDDPAGTETVAPGLFTFDPKGPAPHAVTWWDPHVLDLGAHSSFGIVRDDIIVKDGNMFASDERLAQYERWSREREASIERGSRPSMLVQTATAWARDAAEQGIDTVIAEAADVEIVELDGGGDRPHGPRFGALVHAVLATVPLDSAEDVVRRTAEMQGRLLMSTDAEVSAAVDVVCSVLTHDVMRRARASTAVRRETPVTWVWRDGILVEGVLDLAFDEGDLTTVVDFKTDYELSSGEARYRAQVAQYMTAVARATGRKVRGVLMRI